MNLTVDLTAPCLIGLGVWGLVAGSLTVLRTVWAEWHSRLDTDERREDAEKNYSIGPLAIGAGAALLAAAVVILHL